MDPNLKAKTQDALTKAETIVVAVAKDTGLDGLASGLALYLSCAKLGKNTSISAKEPTVGDAKTLYGVDKIGRVGGKKNLVVVVDDAVENVDKVTYFLEGDKLKITIHPFADAKGVSPKNITFEQSQASPDFIFSIGFKSQAELAQEVTQEQSLDPKVWVINVSKGIVVAKFAQLNVNNPQASSISELTGQLLGDLALPVDEDISYNLYKGITEATRNFSPAQTSQNSLQIASWLLKFGAGKASFAGGTREKSATTNALRQSPFGQRGTGRSPWPDFGEENDFLDTQFPNNVPNLQAIPTQPLAQQPAPTPIETIEKEERSEEDWLKPPKTYTGSKAFDKEG